MHGKFVEFFNSTMGRGHDVLTKVSTFWISILEVWVAFLVAYYLTKYVAIGIAFVPIYITLFNGLSHVIASLALGRYNPGLYTSVLLFFPWCIFLLIYLIRITPSSLLFNGIGLLAAIVGHAIIVVYAVRRRSKLEAGSLQGARVSP